MTPYQQNLAPQTFRFEETARRRTIPACRWCSIRRARRQGHTRSRRRLRGCVAAHGWGDGWRNGIYDFLHFHTRTHEVLGIARGRARVEFGGARGQAIELQAGDVAILPAGTGHRRLSCSPDLLVVGAYPANNCFDQHRPTQVSHDKAVADIATTSLPQQHPMFGSEGPLKTLWKFRRRRWPSATTAPAW